MLKILDSTLREGEQTPGVCFNSHIKAAISRLLDRVGVDIIETGHPAVTDDIAESVKTIAGSNLNASVGAHARSLAEDVDLALECGVNFLGIFYCVSSARLDHMSTKLNSAIDMIAGTIRYAKEQSPDLLIRYTPEDTVRSDWQNVVDAAAEAVRAGADIISIADTTGYMLPGSSRNMYDYVKRLKESLNNQDLNPVIAVHCHNDRGLALANALDGIRGGAGIVDASVLGLGERAGIVDLGTLLGVLLTDFDFSTRGDLTALTELYQTVSRFSGVPVPVNLPVTGTNAFTHCAGVHTQAALKNPLHYQSLAPEPYGRKTIISLDHMSGLSAVRYALDEIEEDNNDHEFNKALLKRIKEVGSMGRTVDITEFRHIVSYFKEHMRNEENL